MTDLEVKKQLLVCPGDSIRDAAEALGLELAELARRLSLTESETNALLNGRARLTPEIAALLETALEIDAAFWLNLETAYRREVSEIARLEDEAASRAF